MRTCWRCGVDFDDSRFIFDAPCEDCQLEVPGKWLKGWSRGRISPEEQERRDKQVIHLYHQHLSDRQIAKALGVGEITIWRYRQRLDLPAYTDLGGTTNWDGDPTVLGAKYARMYWDNPNRTPRRKGKGAAVEGKLSDPAYQQYRKEYLDASVSGKNQTFRGLRSEKFTDQRRKDG